MTSTMVRLHRPLHIVSPIDAILSYSRSLILPLRDLHISLLPPLILRLEPLSYHNRHSSARRSTPAGASNCNLPDSCALYITVAGRIGLLGLDRLPHCRCHFLSKHRKAKTIRPAAALYLWCRCCQAVETWVGSPPVVPQSRLFLFQHRWDVRGRYTKRHLHFRNAVQPSEKMELAFRMPWLEIIPRTWGRRHDGVRMILFCLCGAILRPQ